MKYCDFLLLTKSLGYTVVDINNAGYHYRINDTIDIFPKKKRVFYLKTRVWGTYQSEEQLFKDTFNEENKEVSKSKADIAEQILRNAEKRLSTGKIVSRPRQILLEEIIKYL